MKILIIGATHGNELLGVKLYSYILKKRKDLTEYVDFVVGNPRAFAARKRFTEQDLNRSYGTSGNSYEEKRAREIASYIRKVNPDIVLDMHTTVCEQPNCLIVPDVKGVNKRRYLRASHIKKILQVAPMNDIVTLANNIVGYEVPNKCINLELLEAICDDISRFVAGDDTFKQKQLYKMTDKIYKIDVKRSDADQFVNFQTSHLGYIPVMTGENSYKKHTDYLGFKSEPPRKIEV